METVEGIIEEWKHFCECMDFGASFLDARAITFMNTFEKSLMNFKPIGKGD